MRMLASAMAAAAGLGTAGGVALVAHQADSPRRTPAAVTTGHPAATAPPRTVVVVVRPAGPRPKPKPQKPKRRHGKGDGGDGRGNGDGGDG